MTGRDVAIGFNRRAAAVEGRLLEARQLFFRLGYALSLLLAGLHWARRLDRTGLLGQPDFAEVTLADVGEDVGDF